METIDHRDLPRFVPGKLLASGDGKGWKGVSYRRYAYCGLDIELPPLSEFMVISYLEGKTPVHRKVDRSWRDEHCGAQDVTLLTRASRSEWSWSRPIEVSHVYLTQALVADVANEAFDRCVSDVRLRDILRMRDAAISRCVATISAEARNIGIGGRLVVEAAAQELAVRLLRQYAHSDFVSDARLGSLSASEKARVEEMIEDQLSEKISYVDVATQLGIGPWTFSRRFKAAYDCTFHEFVLRKRVEKAEKQILRSSDPVKAIALDCGFSDQSHMNRTFRKIRNLTPGQLRSGSRR